MPYKHLTNGVAASCHSWGEHETDEGQTIANMIQSMPLIVALRVKVSSYHSKCTTKYYKYTIHILALFNIHNTSALNLTTKFGSSILVNLPIQPAAMLKEW